MIINLKQVPCFDCCGPESCGEVYAEGGRRRCRGENCAAWRPVSLYRGYCGLAGVPQSVAIDVTIEAFERMRKA